MGEKARLRRDLIIAQQQRDRALAERDRLALQVEALRDTVPGRRPSISTRLLDWVADLDQRIRQAVGL